MQKSKNLHWYNYTLVLFYYLISFLLTYGLFTGFLKDSSFSLCLRLPILFLYSFLLIFTLYYHYKTMTINTSINFIENKIPLISNKECLICKIQKQNRTHHCSVCNVCIDEMDHHCPWVANCIGKKNEREFIYFMFGAFITLILLFLVNLNYFIKDNFLYSNNDNNNLNVIGPLKVLYNILDKNIESFTCLISLICAIGVFIIFLNYILMNVRYNMTSIELLKYGNNIKDCPYYNDDLKGNLLNKIKPFPFGIGDEKFIDIFMTEDCENVMKIN